MTLLEQLLRDFKNDSAALSMKLVEACERVRTVQAEQMIMSSAISRVEKAIEKEKERSAAR